MDPRFYTPRQCGSVSSRSQHSQNSDGSTTNSYTTARDSHSVRSAGSSVYRTPRSSPFPSNRRRHTGSGGHDRSRDLRRFSDQPQHQRQPNQYYNDEYDSQPIQIQRTEARRHRDYDRVEQQQQEESRPPPNILSLSRHGRSTEIQAMLNHGTPIDTSDDNGNTILHIGCQNGHKKIVKLAIQYGGDVNAVNGSGNTGLHYAMKYNKTKISEYLISKGADANIRNHEGRRCTDV